MPQKMRMLFALFITLPLILSIELKPGFGESSIFSDVYEEIKEKWKIFSSKTEEEKFKILEELDGSILKEWDINDEKVSIGIKK